MLYDFIVVLNEGLIFCLVVFGLYLTFSLLRFPDLTPDGSFTIGAVAFVWARLAGSDLLLAFLASFVAGVLSGAATAFFYRTLRIPSVVAGLLIATGLYSISWLILGKPNQFIDPANTLTPHLVGFYRELGNFYVISIFLAFSGCAIYLASNTVWGLRLRAIGENPLLASDLGVSDGIYTAICLGIANGIIAIAGALFAIRSYSVDVNMGVGLTILGLGGLVLGLIGARYPGDIAKAILLIIVAGVLYKGMYYFLLKAGIPAESFKLISAIALAFIFYGFRVSERNVFRDLRWK